MINSQHVLRPYGAGLKFNNGKELIAGSWSLADLIAEIQDRFTHQKDVLLTVAASMALESSVIMALGTAMTSFNRVETDEACCSPLTVATYERISEYQQAVDAAINENRQNVMEVCRTHFLPANIMDLLSGSFDTNSPHFSIWI